MPSPQDRLLAAQMFALEAATKARTGDSAGKQAYATESLAWSAIADAVRRETAAGVRVKIDGQDVSRP